MQIAFIQSRLLLSDLGMRVMNLIIANKELYWQVIVHDSTDKAMGISRKEPCRMIS